MGVVLMQKVAIIAHEALKEELIEALHREGTLEITERENSSGKIDHTEVEFRAAELQFAIATLQTIATKETLAATKKPATEESVLYAANHTDVRGIVDALHALESRDTEAERQLSECLSLQETLQSWLNLREPLNLGSSTSTTVRLYGYISEYSYPLLESTLQKQLSKTCITRVHSAKEVCAVVANIWKEDAQRFEELATSLGWSTEELPCLDGMAAAVYEDATVRRKELEHTKRKNHDARVQLSVELPNLLKVARFMRWLDEKQGAREAMGSTASTITLFGWMPKNRVAIVESRLQKVSSAIVILKVKPDKGEEPPVALQNSKFITPFQSVTGLYGLPLYSEWDPTRSLSLFFILFFGLCLTDAGYGAILALVFGATLWKLKRTPEEAPLLWLLFLCGVVTFFVSIPFGGWFGLPANIMPEFLTRTTADGMVMYKGQIWNLSQKSGIDFLTKLSLILGLTHLFFGMFLAGWFKWVHGKKAAAFWLDFTNHMLFGAAILYAVAPSQNTLYTLYSAIVLMIWGKGHGTKWFLRPLMGLLGTVNFSISMLSNTLSYLRILALGLVTGALAGAVNQVAAAIGNLLPVFLAIPVIVGIFIVGHTISIALNALGSFIHSGRLQFIEFFGQFFEGGGRAFSPFKRTTL
jgi:V/A-type H+/Na+-transporting ATPase subunit I